jgi:hypothetical protein
LALVINLLRKSSAEALASGWRSLHPLDALDRRAAPTECSRQGGITQKQHTESDGPIAQDPRPPLMHPAIDPVTQDIEAGPAQPAEALA